MKLRLLILLFFTVLFSCNKHEDKIEIFLLKERIRSSEGIPVLEYAKSKNIQNEDLKNVEDCNYDTIAKQLIFGGKFYANKNDIIEKPLIEDNEILGLNLDTNEIILSDSGRKKIALIKPNMKYGIQFVIGVNGIPNLTGYFRSNISSNIYNWNYISYDYFEHNITTVHDKNFVVRQNIGYEKWKPVLSNLKEYPKLISAFKNTKRLNEKASCQQPVSELR